MQVAKLEAADLQLRSMLNKFNKEKESVSQGETEMKMRINQLLGMLREAEDTAMREAAYHERVVSDYQNNLESSNHRLETLESLNVS